MFKLFLIGLAGIIGYGIGRTYTVAQGADFYVVRTANGREEYIKLNPDGTFSFVADSRQATLFDGMTALRIRNLLRSLSQDNTPIRLSMSLNPIVQTQTTTATTTP